MPAQPIFEEPGPDDPAQILRVLAGGVAAFLAEYRQALESALRPEQYRELTAFLRLWRLRAVAYSDPGYTERLAAAEAGDTTGDVYLLDRASERLLTRPCALNARGTR